MAYEDLKIVESQLAALLFSEQKSWVVIYRLIKRVESESLWEVSYKSLTQWVKSFSSKYKIHESIIWQRKKAGEVYYRYKTIKDTKDEAQKEVGEIETLDRVSPETIELASKVAGRDNNIFENLMDRVVTSELSREDLRSAYREKRDAAGPKEHRPIPITTMDAAATDVKFVAKANDIAEAFNSNGWMGTNHLAKKRPAFLSAYTENKYKAFQEFPLFAGTTRRSRRVDVLIAENLSTENIYELAITGVEIKVDKGDLVSDQKYAEYAPFLDFLYIAIPDEEGIREAATETVPEEYGIIVYTAYGLMINRVAKKLEGESREETLKNIVLKIL